MTNTNKKTPPRIFINVAPQTTDEKEKEDQDLLEELQKIFQRLREHGHNFAFVFCLRGDDDLFQPTVEAVAPPDVALRLIGILAKKLGNEPQW